MNPELQERAETLWKADDKLVRYGSKRRPPSSEAGRIYEEMQSLAEEIPQRESPATIDEFHESELKRKLEARSIVLGNFLEGRSYSLNDVIAMFQLDRGDLDGLEPWLRENKDAALEAEDRLYRKTEVEEYEHQLPMDIPEVRQRIEGHAAVHFGNFHETLGPLFAENTRAGEYLYRIETVPTTSKRSYFDLHTRRLALSIEGAFYETEKGQIIPRHRQILRLFGHEGGHALQRTITADADNLFFNQDSMFPTASTDESIAQHFEEVIFDDVLHSPDTQSQLAIKEQYPEIYQEQKDTKLLSDYEKRLFYYAIQVMADKSFGPPNDADTARALIEKIGELALSASDARFIVENNRYRYDTEGNLERDFAGELRYASQPVDRSLAIFEQRGISYRTPEGRNLIDLTLLNGYYTPKGLEQRAALVAAGKTDPFVEKSKTR